MIAYKLAVILPTYTLFFIKEVVLVVCASYSMFATFTWTSCSAIQIKTFTIIKSISEIMYSSVHYCIVGSLTGESLVSCLWFAKLRVVEFNNPLADLFIYQTFSTKCLINLPSNLPAKRFHNMVYQEDT